MTKPRDTISAAIRATASRGRPAVVGFMTAGFPDRASFRGNLAAIAGAADVVEIGVPFSDPMADGMTIQRASRPSSARARPHCRAVSRCRGCSTNSAR